MSQNQLEQEGDRVTMEFMAAANKYRALEHRITRMALGLAPSMDLYDTIVEMEPAAQEVARTARQVIDHMNKLRQKDREDEEARTAWIQETVRRQSTGEQRDG